MKSYSIHILKSNLWVFRESYSIHILKTKSYDVQRKLQYTYLKNKFIGCSEEVTI